MLENIRQKFTKNAEEFDALVVEILGENDELRAALSYARKRVSKSSSDAARYRWMRDNSSQGMCSYLGNGTQQNIVRRVGTAKDFDSFIDDAISEGVN